MDNKKMTEDLCWIDKFNTVENHGGLQLVECNQLDLIVDILGFKLNDFEIENVISRDVYNVFHWWIDHSLNRDHGLYYTYNPSWDLNELSSQVAYVFNNLPTIAKNVQTELDLANTVNWKRDIDINLELVEESKQKCEYWDNLENCFNYRIYKQHVPLKYLFVKH